MAGTRARLSRREAEEFAERTLTDHGLFAVPVNPVRVANALGISVQNAVFRDPRLAGMATRRGEHSLILVKEDDPLLRKRFTVAHEVGHCLLHLSDDDLEIADTEDDFFRTGEPESKAWSQRRQIEFEANAFAAALLMPQRLVAEFWERIPERERNVEVMASIFQVSQASMGIRLQALGLI